MPIRVLTVAALLALTACSSTGGGKLPVCDGKHLRPANPYGTVLAPAATPPPPAGTSETKPVSLIGSPAVSGSCRA